MRKWLLFFKDKSALTLLPSCRRSSSSHRTSSDREFLGFGGQLTRTQISDRLRRAACSFVREKLQYDLAAQLKKDGISPDAFKVTVDITPISTTDPETIKVEYTPAFEVRNAWKKDYQAMQESMIYEESPSFEQLIEKLTALNKRINALKY